MTSFNCKAIPTMPLLKCLRMPFLSILLTISCCFFQSSHSFVNRVGKLGYTDTFHAIRSGTNLYVTTANPLTEQGPRHATSSVSHHLCQMPCIICVTVLLALLTTKHHMKLMKFLLDFSFVDTTGYRSKTWHEFKPASPN